MYFVGFGTVVNVIGIIFCGPRGISIGAMAVVIGAIEDRLMNNYSILFAKIILDLTIMMIMTSFLGKGCIFSAISVGISKLITLF